MNRENFQPRKFLAIRHFFVFYVMWVLNVNIAGWLVVWKAKSRLQSCVWIYFRCMFVRHTHQQRTLHFPSIWRKGVLCPSRIRWILWHCPVWWHHTQWVCSTFNACCLVTDRLVHVVLLFFRYCSQDSLCWYDQLVPHLYPYQGIATWL